jgi:hypothetical protein
MASVTNKRTDTTTALSNAAVASWNNAWVMATVFLTLVVVGIGVFVSINFQKGENGTPGKSVGAGGDYQAGASYAEGTVVRFASASWIVKPGRIAVTAPAEGLDWQLLVRDGEGTSSARARGSVTTNKYIPSTVVAEQQSETFDFGADLATPVVVASSKSNIITQVTGVTDGGATIICSTALAAPNLSMSWEADQLTNTCFSHKFVNQGTADDPVMVPAVFWSSGTALHYRVAQDVAGASWDAIIDVGTTTGDVVSVAMTQHQQTLEVVLMWVDSDDVGYTLMTTSLVGTQRSPIVTRVMTSNRPQQRTAMDVVADGSNLMVAFSTSNSNFVLLTWDRATANGPEAMWSCGPNEIFKMEKVRIIIASGISPVIYASGLILDAVDAVAQLWQFTVNQSDATKLTSTIHAPLQPGDSQERFQWVNSGSSLIIIREHGSTRFVLVSGGDNSVTFMIGGPVNGIYKNILSASDAFSVLEVHDAGGMFGLIPSLFTSMTDRSTGVQSLNHFDLSPRSSVIDWAVV